MDQCKVCGKPSMVMSGDYSSKVPFKKARDAKSFTCGLCVAHGYFKPETSQPDEKQFDLREWRKSKGFTQTELAEKLFVSRVQVSKVEAGDRVLPKRWMPILEKMYPTHA